MSETAPEIRGPREDDRRMWDVLSGIFGYPAVLVAHDLGLFPLLAAEPRSLQQVCDALGIARRPAEALLAVCSSLGFASKADDRYRLTPFAEDYLLESGSAYFGGYLDHVIQHYSVWSFESLKKAVLSDSPQAYGGRDVFEVHEQEAEQARSFTLAMHGLSMGPGLAWPKVVDLSGCRLMLDIGGGSGAHSIGAANTWPELHAAVVDLAPVCEIAREIAESYGMGDRIGAVAADIWNDPFPPADVHFYSMIFHDWSEERCRFLAQKSFESLEPNGRIIVHEMLFDDDRTGPFPVAAFNTTMLLWVEGEQYSGGQITAMLADTGFVDIEVTPTFGHWSIVIGRKP